MIITKTVEKWSSIILYNTIVCSIVNMDMYYVSTMER
jgi:hypothetical protein